MERLNVTVLNRFIRFWFETCIDKAKESFNFPTSCRTIGTAMREADTKLAANAGKVDRRVDRAVVAVKLLGDPVAQDRFL